MDAKGKTLYGRIVERKCLLGPGPQENSTKKTRCIRLHRVSSTPLAETTLPTSQGSPPYGTMGERASQENADCRRSLSWGTREFKGREKQRKPQSHVPKQPDT